MDRPLSGVKVLAVEQYGAGPFGTQHLADLGADVIKVENHTTGGDYARALGPYFADEERDTDSSLFFQSVNRNKRSMTLDLSKPDGQAVFHRLVAEADVVANNLRGDVPDKLGLTYDALKAHNPAIVCGHCSAYGRDGPRRTWPGYDYLMQAEAGYFHITGEPEAPPTRIGLSLVDFMGGTYLALSISAGLVKARASGIGGDVDVNLFDTALFNLNYLATWSLNHDYIPGRAKRSAHPSIVPCQMYRTADGWIYLMLNKERFFGVFCELIDRPDLAREARFATIPDRLANRDTLTEILDAELMQRTTDEWLSVFLGVLPAAPILTPRDALDNPYVAERGRIETLTLENGTSFDVLASPLAAARPDGSRPCPSLGHDTEAVLGEAGFDADQIARLRGLGII